MSRGVAAGVTLNHLDAWFKIGAEAASDPPVTVLAGSALGGREYDPITKKAADVPKESCLPSFHRKKNAEIDPSYPHAYQAAAKLEAETYGTNEHDVSDLHSLATMDNLEAMSSISGLTNLTTVVRPEVTASADALEVYKKYDFKHEYPATLPITSCKDEIIQTIDQNPVVIIQGSTGSGKTTQVPQYLLEYYKSHNRYCNIIVTQPRRIAAMMIASRVCSERGWGEPGHIVGYQVSMDSKVSEDTRITYVTTGVLMERLIGEKNLLKYTHVILDEVHERDQDTDFCLLIVRKFLRTNSRHCRVILMSATMQSHQFAKYFEFLLGGELNPAHVISVEGKMYSVSEYYLDDLEGLGYRKEDAQTEKPEVTPQTRAIAKNLIKLFDDIEEKEFTRKRRKADDDVSWTRGAVLVFLPGLLEIQDLEIALENDNNFKSTLCIVPLHSTIGLDEQRRAFQQVPVGSRKVILATNIAESSITVRDIKYVIDFCLTKNQVCDPETNYPCLKLEWASKSQCIQRRGRAGRVQSGRVYRMITRQFWEEYIPDQHTPEMQRCPLEQLVLKTKLLDVGEPKAVLALAISPPQLFDIQKTILLLKEVGALSTPNSVLANPHDGNLTFLGRILAKLPIYIHLGKLICLGYVFGLLSDCVIMAASMNLKSLFCRPYKGDKLEAYRQKMDWDRGQFSDPIAALNAYREWCANTDRGTFRFGSRQERDWCRRNGLEQRNLHEVKDLEKDLEQRLQEFNLVEQNSFAGGDGPRISMPDRNLLLKVIIAGAFYPNFFHSQLVDEQDALREVAGRNPLTTVWMKNLPPNQGRLYREEILNYLRDCHTVDREFFEETRAYIQFVQPPRLREASDYSGRKTPDAMYLALKLRKIMPCRIRLFKREVAEKALTILKQHQSSSGALRSNLVSTQRVQARYKTVDLPDAQTTILKLDVHDVVDCGHFWATKADEETAKLLNDLHREINQFPETTTARLSEKPAVGEVCLAPYLSEYYRAKVERVNNNTVMVFFVDFGNREEVQQRELRTISKHLLQMPFQAMECMLSHIRPSAVSTDGTWSPYAVAKFRDFLRPPADRRVRRDIYGKVFSVVDSIVRLELVQKTSGMPQLLINQRLVELGQAEYTEESLASRENHELRRAQQNADFREIAPRDRTDLTSHDSMAEVDKFLKEHSETGRSGAWKNLGGPYNPYELNFSSLTWGGKRMVVRLSPDSACSVVLSDDPLCNTQRLLVAGIVGTTPDGTALQLREATLMPDVLGLTPLLSMLFSPLVELRTDKNKRRHIGVLCGLGSEPEVDGQRVLAVLKDHDMEIAFDFRFTRDDLRMINSTRMIVNLLLSRSDESIAPEGRGLRDLQKQARDRVLQLLKAKRQRMDEETYERAFRWKECDANDIMTPNVADENVNSSHLYALHCDVALMTEEQEAETRYNEMLRHLNELNAKAGMSLVPDRHVCRLCNVTLAHAKALRNHLVSPGHKENERMLLA